MKKSDALLRQTRAFAAELAEQRRERQHRRMLDPADLQRLREIGSHEACIPVAHGGLWEDPRRSVRIHLPRLPGDTHGVAGALAPGDRGQRRDLHHSVRWRHPRRGGCRDGLHGPPVARPRRAGPTTARPREGGVGDAQREAWLAQQAYDGALRALERHGRSRRDAQIAKADLSTLAESVLARLCRIVGGGAYSRNSPLGHWFEDARAAAPCGRYGRSRWWASMPSDGKCCRQQALPIPPRPRRRSQAKETLRYRSHSPMC